MAGEQSVLEAIGAKPPEERTRIRSDDIDAIATEPSHLGAIGAKPSEEQAAEEAQVLVSVPPNTTTTANNLQTPEAKSASVH